MDEKSKIHIKAMKSEHESIRKSLNQIIDTLNTDTPLQDNNDKLGFFVSQMESIMKSYRFDISQLRRLQLACICLPMLIILIMAITIPLSLKYVKEIYAMSMMLLFIVFIMLFIVLSLRFCGNISYKLKKLEEEMEDKRIELFHLHIRIYHGLINNEFIVPYFHINELEEMISSLKKAKNIKDNNIENLKSEMESCIDKMEQICRERYKIKEFQHWN